MNEIPGLSIVMPLVERGILPEPLVRWGIRRMNAGRLAQEKARYDEHRLRRFAESLSASEIALTPEKANEQHYELPAGFFQLTLGKHLKYSSCYWPDGVSTLDDAEAAALTLTCERAQIVDGMDILELGCGWGSLTLWMAKNYPNARITAVSNSNSQRVFIERQCRMRRLQNVHVVTCDMNDFSVTSSFDRVVSVEMFEHMRNYEALLARIAGWLRPGGRLFVHIFCHRRYPYLFETDGAGNWMGRHFFTSGMMPSMDLLPLFQREMAMEQLWFMRGHHYARTAEAWLSNLDERQNEAMLILRDAYGRDARIWFVRWRLFFLACAELFQFEGGEEWGVVHYLFRKPVS
ncbi:MAG: class I SAM-dependent methyltransferase [Phycisphaerales bacterium]|nr:class I SAM-dependent methyltransferase [Phycisphaerales bacterium]MCB9858575.1 class I SAM-dependent methyltransferase [Phycisphaerales bacterium]